MRRLMTKVAKVAKSDAAVLLDGEIGHRQGAARRARCTSSSPRASKPFVTVDCGALAAEPGRERAVRPREGRLHRRRARGTSARSSGPHGGTLFLDEIGELPLALQAKLLGVLERATFRRVGGSRAIDVDVRMVARDAPRPARRGERRHASALDLFYRLAVVRARGAAAARAPRRRAAAGRALPARGGARRAGRRAGLAARDGRAEARTTGRATCASCATWSRPRSRWESRRRSSLAPRPLPRPRSRPARTKHARAEALAQFERAYLGGLIERSKGNVSEASRLARMDRSHLIELLKKHQLK